MDLDKLKQLMSSARNRSEEIDALAEPSVMDEYIQKNDPEQWDRISRAQAIKSAIDSGSSIGSIGTKAPQTAQEALSNGVRRIIGDSQRVAPKPRIPDSLGNKLMPYKQLSENEIGNFEKLKTLLEKK